MTTTHYDDTCPACGNRDVIPYAVIVGGSEEYGYQCLSCEVSWPVLTHSESGPVIASPLFRSNAVRKTTAAVSEGLEGERRHRGSAIRGRTPPSSSHGNDTQSAASS